MKRTKKVALCMGSILILTIGIILGQNLPKLNLSSRDNTKSKTIAMYLENESGGYDLSNQTKFPTDGYVLNTEKSSCKNGGTLSQDPTTKKLSLSVSNSDQCNVYFDKVKDLTSNDILAKFGETSQGERTTFDAAATTDEGIYEMEDDYGTSYYYRGAVENNYVKYGRNASGQEMWWRIIRINGDGSVRMIYDGTQGYANGTNGSARYIKTSQPYNATYNDAKYVGWMYGPAGTTASTSKVEAQSNAADSDIKKIVDAWYKENILDTGYGANVSDAIFCNDRQIETDLANSNGGQYSSYTTLGFGTNKTLYKAASRNGYNVTNPQPTFVCGEKNDAFTVRDTTKGNGALTYPVGLITADEIVAAGSGKYGTANNKYYLYHGTGYVWSLSPYSCSNGNANVFNVGSSGHLNSAGVNNTSGAVAPVINLSAEYASTLRGTGTIEDPYRAA